MKTINRQTHIFIFELVIAIAFFALASSICVQFFVKAHSLSKETNDINISMNLATGYVEEFLNDPTIYQVNQDIFIIMIKTGKIVIKRIQLILLKFIVVIKTQ